MSDEMLNLWPPRCPACTLPSYGVYAQLATLVATPSFIDHHHPSSGRHGKRWNEISVQGNSSPRTEMKDCYANPRASRRRIRGFNGAPGPVRARTEGSRLGSVHIETVSWRIPGWPPRNREEVRRVRDCGRAIRRHRCSSGSPVAIVNSACKAAKPGGASAWRQEA